MLPAPDPAPTRSRARWAVAGLAALAAAALAVLGFRDHLPDVAAALAPALAAVRAAGIWAPAVFVLLQTVATVAPVPRTVFTVAAGVLFGSLWGALVAVLATTSAAVLAFWLVRLGTARFVARHADRRAMAWVHQRLDHRGMLAVLSLRLLPMVPFPVLNYASGASGVRFAPYLAGTVLGVLPGTLAVVVLSDAVVGGAPDPRLLAVSVACTVLGAAGVLLASRRPMQGRESVPCPPARSGGG
ncbi:TVP38/TMEM64 family protein [Pseudonocardia sp.]|uniref:TVP38/TMEM64 family protein n=1 Tax=Pseudonocardia sp. TaxID=60912 RepID=UPI003D0CD37B